MHPYREVLAMAWPTPQDYNEAIQNNMFQNCYEQQELSKTPICRRKSEHRRFVRQELHPPPIIGRASLPLTGIDHTEGRLIIYYDKQTHD
jgi:hypothetical protein